MAINVLCPINNLGFGCIGLNVCLALDKLGQNPAVWPIGQVEADPQHHDSIRKWVANQATFDGKAPSLRVYHQFSLAEHVGSPRAAYPFFELNRFKPVERHHLLQQDVLFAPSRWAADVLAKEGVASERIKLARPGVDRKLFFQAQEDWRPGDVTVFLTVGKWEVRKGHDFLINCFNKAFNETDNVQLHMHCFNPCFRTMEEIAKYNNEWTRFAKTSKLGNKIEVSESRFASQHELAILMASCHCGVFPSRAEGWGLESAEMLVMGKHIIITDYSSHTEYANNSNSRLISIDKTVPAHDGVWFRADDPVWRGKPGEWADLGESQEEQLISHMRQIHSLVQEGRLGTNYAGIETMKKFTWENTAKEIINGFSN